MLSETNGFVEKNQQQPQISSSHTQMPDQPPPAEPPSDLDLVHAYERGTIANLVHQPPPIADVADLPGTTAPHAPPKLVVTKAQFR